MLQTAERLGQEYPGEDISLLRGTAVLEEERRLLGNDAMLIGLIPSKRRKTFTGPHDVVSHKT